MSKTEWKHTLVSIHQKGNARFTITFDAASAIPSFQKCLFFYRSSFFDEEGSNNSTSI